MAGGCMEGKIANRNLVYISKYVKVKEVTVDTQTNPQENTKKWAEKSRSKALPCMMVLLRHISSL